MTWQHHLAFTATFACAFLLSDTGAAGQGDGNSKVLYQDDFSDVLGFVSTNSSGEYIDGKARRTRNAHSYMSDTRYGDMTMTVREDNKAKGQDGKPGLLAFSIDERPSRVSYSGFTYAGRPKQPLKFESLKNNPDREALSRLRLSFRYRATNENTGHSGARYDFRIEPDIDESFDSRLDLGSIRAYVTWNKFDSSLRIGRNQTEFLQAIEDHPNAAFKLIWSQKGGIGGYDEGDTLLIDDIQITISE